MPVQTVNLADLGNGSPSDLTFMISLVAVFFILVIACSIIDAQRENTKRYGNGGKR